MTPTSDQELADLIRDADTPLRISGGGTRGDLGNPVEGTHLSTAGLNGITLYEPGALTLIAQAGTPVAEVEAALASEGQMLPFEPMDHRALMGTTGTPTIGAVAACNISGPRRIQAGAARDSMIGVRFVDGRGDVIQNGGRVMKNVTGYDLVKLMAGSYGTLGVLTEISFKVLPRPEAAATVSIDGLEAEAAIATLCRAMGSPNDVTGAAYVGGTVHLRVEGFEGSVAFRAEALKTLFKDRDIAVEMDAAKNAQLWQSIRDVEALSNTTGNIWRLSCKPTEAPGLVAALSARHDIKAAYDWSGGLVWIAAPGDADLRATTGSFDGHLSLIRGTGFPAFQDTGPLRRIEAGLRAQFDPKGILNPGVMG